MSAQPAPQPQPEKSSTRQETALMVEALLSDAEVQQKWRESQIRLRQAVAQDAAELEFYWITPDDREAELRVYYRSGEQPEILAAELLQLDGRRPTQGETAQLEDEFDAQIHDHGDLWLRVASAIWER